MENRRKELETTFHLIYLCIITFFGLLQLIIACVTGESTLLIVLWALILLAVWLLHFVQIGSATQRIYCYAMVTTLFLMVYGSYETSICDMPIILCILLVVLSIQSDMGLLYLVSISYPLMILHHIFITHYINLDMEWIPMMRIVIGVPCVVIALIVARFFVKTNENVKLDKEQLEEQVASSKQQTKNLLSNVSHELRTPINAINGISEILLEQHLNAQLEHQLEDINEAGHRILDQVNCILEYAEITSNQMVLNEHNYSVKEVAEECMKNIRMKPNERNLRIVMELDEGLPAQLYGDSQKIIRIATLLLDNAYKFTNHGGVLFQVGIRKESYGCNLDLIIKDTGIGMSRALVRRLFRGAYKDDAESVRLTGGLGIGFTIAHEMTRVMKGFIHVESEEGCGTIVHVSLPQKMVEEALPQPVEEPTPAEKQALRILVVDDELLNLKVVRGILAAKGYEVRIAESGAEGLALCELEDFGFIFLDYMMPEMDGEETLKRIRTVRNGYYAKTPIVALTANAQSGARSMFLEMGFDEFVSKPVESEKLYHLIASLMRMNHES